MPDFSNQTAERMRAQMAPRELIERQRLLNEVYGAGKPVLDLTIAPSPAAPAAYVPDPAPHGRPSQDESVSLEPEKSARE